MSLTSRTLGIAFVILFLGGWVAGCGSSLGDDDDENRDLATRDIGVVLPDMTMCEQAVFGGFPGTTAVERRLDCPCGCLIDTLEHATNDGLWAVTASSATLSDSSSGVTLDVDGDATPASAGLESLAVSDLFYVENDFDLRVDYSLQAAAPGGVTLLRVDLQDGTYYSVSRAQTPAGADVYASTLNGQAASSTTTAMSGTLRIQRLGSVITVYGDSAQIGQLKTGESTRVAIELGAQVSGCPDAMPDGGTACTEQVTLHDVRLVAGALVDRL